MNLQKRIKITFIALLICLILLISASLAWLTMSLAPEVTSIDTNVGANGSLEIALLSDKTYVDPLLIRTTAGDSAVVQDALESNLSWGNVIELSDERYGMAQLSLHPARLNLIQEETGKCTVNGNMLKIAQFGIDGRISILSDQTVSALYEEDSFVYHVANQKYGVRAIGTVSHIESQQTALTSARTAAQSYTAAASRTVKNAWRDNGNAIMDIFSRRYADGRDQLTAADITFVQDTAVRMQDALTYVELALRQGIIGIAASKITDGSDFDEIYAVANNHSLPLSVLLDSVTEEIPDAFKSWANQLNTMKTDVQTVVLGCSSLANGCTWEQMEPLLDVLVDAEKAYLGDYIMATQAAFENVAASNVLTLAPESGVMAKLAEYAGNYSSFYRWTETVNVEVRTADPVETPHLLQIVDTLKNSTAASGGWTRAELDDTYGYAMDLAFRCNADSDLLLQTVASLRVDEKSEFPVTQGAGSYMRFTSEHLETERIVRLMDTIRVGFLDDKNTLIGLAKLNTSNYEEQEDGVMAPLYLYEYSLEEDGSLSIGERQKDNSAILSLNRSTPAIITVVVWLDGDYVDNSYVSHQSDQSMSGVMNLQFASSADLHPSNQVVQNKK